MSNAWRIAVVYALAVGFGVVAGCAGRSKGSKSPKDCMYKCDQEECQYEANGLGDNDAYLECLEACEDKCGGGEEES